ncbi:MAG: hypothetical protein J6033_03810, partial [Lachnospiraceae bacterium]|nr:hypothetical protein [Lachnospiraceae bacterium]
MEDRIDIKELLILLKNKLIIFCIAILLCGLAGLILRFAYCKVAGPGSEYVFTQTFLVEYGTDPQVGQSYTYINAATWDRIMDMDSFVEMVMAEMTDDSVTEADVRASLSADLATDLRIPNIEVRNTDEKKAEAILAAAGNAFVKYGDLRKEIDSVEIADTTGPDIDKNIDRLPQAFILGLIIGIIICAVFFAFKYILSDGIYTLKKASDRFGKPAIAAFDKNGSISEFEKSALEAFVGDKKTYAVFLDRDLPEAEKGSADDLSELSNLSVISISTTEITKFFKNGTGPAEASVIFMIKSGERSLGFIKNTMDNLEILGIKTGAVCLYDADPAFIRGYRGG